MNFNNNVDFTEEETGRFEAEFQINNEKYVQELPTSRTTRYLTASYHNFEDTPVVIQIAVKLTGESQLINSAEIILPGRSTAECRYEFNALAISDIDTIIQDADDNLVNPYFILGSNEFRTGEGLAGGKVIIETDSPNDYECRSIEYTLDDQDLLLNLEADNISQKRFRLTISNCYLYNASGQNLLEFEELVQVAFFPNDCYNLMIRINADGTVAVNQERI